MTVEHTHRLNRILAQLVNVGIREITDHMGTPVEPYFWIDFDDSDASWIMTGIWDPLSDAAQMDIVLHTVEGHIS